ncbi:uncharacterized protein BDZ99DRAFT_519602 [Mytilinidion resinicola]|uniref:Uncharacterized protein n=1 Tax=Mytilinidion resinicola TaxID=574789 RepID=A0A6A6YPV1_9PEZI|nr:uncharacterized protein BDZ99DRAFT_519602 [Mytilinidion resinicola]KAF2810926.1 hypothetical protein BDZ99DRAFT_519602 [Mytilinidion resinicola]
MLLVWTGPRRHHVALGASCFAERAAVILLESWPSPLDLSPSQSLPSPICALPRPDLRPRHTNFISSWKKSDGRVGRPGYCSFARRPREADIARAAREPRSSPRSPQFLPNSSLAHFPRPVAITTIPRSSPLPRRITARRPRSAASLAASRGREDAHPLLPATSSLHGPLDAVRDCASDVPEPGVAAACR